jgi:hypothetical protein
LALKNISLLRRERKVLPKRHIESAGTWGMLALLAAGHGILIDTSIKNRKITFKLFERVLTTFVE